MCSFGTKGVRVREMKEIYSFIKNMIPTLSVCGWDAQFAGIEYGDGSKSLFEWFKRNINHLKNGRENFIHIVSAVASGDYATREDKILLSSNGRTIEVYVLRYTATCSDNELFGFNSEIEKYTFSL